MKNIWDNKLLEKAKKQLQQKYKELYKMQQDLYINFLKYANLKPNSSKICYECNKKIVIMCGCQFDNVNFCSYRCAFNYWKNSYK